MGCFRNSRRSNLLRGLLPLPGCCRIARNNGSDLLSHRDFSINLLSCNIFVILSKSNLFLLVLNYFVAQGLIRDLWSHQMSLDGTSTQRVISDKVHRLLVTLFYFRPDIFLQLLSLKPILI